MPNHVTNIIHLRGDAEQIRKLRQAVMNDRFGPGSIDFEKVIPMPDDIFRGDLDMTQRSRYGEKNWYDWSTKNWGTKWNAYGFDELRGHQGVDTICFMTAWKAPHNVIGHLAQMYPDLELEHNWADDDFGNNCGKRVYSNGILDSVYEPEYGRESQEHAASVRGEELADRGLVLNEEGTEYVYRESEETFDISMGGM